MALSEITQRTSIAGDSADVLARYRVAATQMKLRIHDERADGFSARNVLRGYELVVSVAQSGAECLVVVDGKADKFFVNDRLTTEAQLLIHSASLSVGQTPTLEEPLPEPGAPGGGAEPGGDAAGPGEDPVPEVHKVVRDGTDRASDVADGANQIQQRTKERERIAALTAQLNALEAAGKADSQEYQNLSLELLHMERDNEG
jgi:hypothetical protein